MLHLPTQSELARRIGATKTAISRLENGGRDIRLSTVERIAHALGRVVSIELEHFKISCT